PGEASNGEADGPVIFESSAERLRWVPITLFSTSGTLRLEGGRLSFRTSIRKKVVFDFPVDEVHSVASMTSLGIHLWHGSTRYRLSVGSPVYVPTVGESVTGVIGQAASIPGRLEHDRANRRDTAKWVDVLGAAQGAPPSGLRVRRPWPGWTWGVGVVLATLVLVGIITAATLLAG
ncbi:MAG: hypothetical protein ABMA25_23995, partial [Ilumatobacteraceae bacterium]